MYLTSTAGVRGAALLGVGAVTATLLVAVPPAAEGAVPCRITVHTRLDKTATFAGNGMSRYYFATAKGSEVGQYDHKGNVIMTTFPAGAYPSLIHRRIGEREAIGSMTKAQAPRALGSINGDFFIVPDIRYESDIEMVRGPMVRDGKVIRGTFRRQRVIGVDTAMKPFGGFMGVRGWIQAQVTGAPKVKLRSMNWHQVLGGGVNIYTTDWSPIKRSDGKADYPRPAGTGEWGLNIANEIVTIRTGRRNAGQRGDPVAAGTRVIAFSKNSASSAAGVPVGTTVRVNANQSTTTGVKLTTAVGRGLPIVEGGKPAPLGCRAYAATSSAMSARPRTFVGWDDKGRWRSFTVPGSKLEVINGVLLRTGGFGLANAANIAKSLGMTNAYELDGGGSTTLWTRSAQTWSRKDMYKVANPSGCACERFMGNGLAFLPSS
ncbi:MAG: phosphodiester glycosidase family protein [Actinomycetia bacterium]|nr:phosphodiester glycosidase family protein [Actinomycetes bacterium]